MSFHISCIKSIFWAGIAVGGLSTFIATPASAVVVDFNSQQPGTLMGGQYFASSGLVIAAQNAVSTAPNIAITLNSDNTVNQPSNGDLNAPWAGGNAMNTDFGETLVIARDVKDTNGNGLVDQPDAEHGGGQLFFSFNQPVNSFGFDAIHVHDDTEPFTSLIQFYRNGTLVGTVPYSSFTDPTSKYYDPTVVWGDNTANHFQPITAAELGVPDFNSVVLTLTRGSAVDNLNYTFGTSSVPEPAQVAALAFAALPLLRRRGR